ncbi:MAG: hypothetical protein KIT43_05980 [Bauldia sp.]|nr:hypothetical protein [Bauldia sp.]
MKVYTWVPHLPALVGFQIAATLDDKAERLKAEQNATTWNLNDVIDRDDWAPQYLSEMRDNGYFLMRVPAVQKAFEDKVREDVQRRADTRGLGIKVTGVNLGEMTVGGDTVLHDRRPAPAPSPSPGGQSRGKKMRIYLWAPDKAFDADFQIAMTSDPAGRRLLADQPQFGWHRIWDSEAITCRPDNANEIETKGYHLEYSPIVKAAFDRALARAASQDPGLGVPLSREDIAKVTATAGRRSRDRQSEIGVRTGQPRDMLKFMWRDYREGRVPLGQILKVLAPVLIGAAIGLGVALWLILR